MEQLNYYLFIYLLMPFSSNPIYFDELIVRIERNFFWKIKAFQGASFDPIS